MRTADQELLKRWYERSDAEAFREITSRYAGLVYAAARRVLRNASDAEDVAQECFEALALRQDTAPNYLGAWLHTAATNRALNALDSTKRRRAREERAAAERAEVARSEWDDIYEHVDGAIAELPPELRDVVVGHFLEGQRKADLARTLGVSRPTVHYRIDKGLEQVRRTLRERGVTASGGLIVSVLAALETGAYSPVLTAGLGRIAIAGARGANAAPTAWTTLIGSIAMKKALTAVAALAAFSIGLGIALQQPMAPPPAVPPPSTTESPVDGDGDVRAGEAPPTAPTGSTVIDALYEVLANSPEDNWSNSADAGSGNLVIAGRVVNDAGEPVDQVRLEARGGGKLLRVRTPDDGSFRFTGLTSGQYHIQPSHVNFPAQQPHHDVLAGDSSAEIVMQDYLTLHGRVTDARTDSPIKTFSVSVESRPGHDRDPMSAREQRKVQDNDGRFTLTRMIPGDERVVVRARGYINAVEYVEIDTKESNGQLSIALVPGNSLEGIVVNQDGAPVVRALLFGEPPPAVREMMSGFYSTSHVIGGVGLAARSGEDGRFVTAPLPTKAKALHAWHPDFGYGKASITAPGGTADLLEIALQPREVGSLEVLVTVAGEPVEGVYISTRSESHPVLHGSSKTLEDGHALLRELPVGPVKISGRKPPPRRIVPKGSHAVLEHLGLAREFSTAARIVADTKSVVKYDLPAATANLAGSVTLDGRIPQEAHVVLQYSFGEHEESYRSVLTEDSVFAFEGVPAAEARLAVVAIVEGRKRSKIVPVVLKSNETVRLDMDIPRGGAIEGYVNGLDPSRSYSVLAIPGELALNGDLAGAPMALFDQSALTVYPDETGYYTGEGLEDGPYTLVLMSRRRHTSNHAYAVSTGTVVDVSAGDISVMDFDLNG